MKNGFTLIELLIAILIIEILAGVAIPKYQMASGKTKFATLKENAHALKGAMDRYRWANGTYTNQLDVLDVTLNGTYRSDKSFIDLPDGSVCYVEVRNKTYVVYCQMRMFGVQIEYGIQNTGIRRCNVLSRADNIPNRICRQETGKQGTPGVDVWTLYSY